MTPSPSTTRILSFLAAFGWTFLASAANISLTIVHNGGGGLQIYDRHGTPLLSGSQQYWYEYRWIDTNGDGIIDDLDGWYHDAYIYHYEVSIPDNYLNQLVYIWDAGAYSEMRTLETGMDFAWGSLGRSTPPTLPPFETIPGDLLVDGAVDINGPLLNLGTNPANGEPSFDWRALAYPSGDFLDPTNQVLISRASSGLATWGWEAQSPGQSSGLRVLTLNAGYGYASMSLNGTFTALDLMIGGKRPLLPTNGTNSFRLGVSTTANGAYSFAANYGASAQAEGTSAFGLSTLASQKYQFVLGRYNAPQAASNTPQDLDQLFTIGNGTGVATANRSNAFSVTFGGGASVSKSLTVGVGSSAPAGVSVKAAAAIGEGTQAASGQTVLGKFNREDSGLLIVGDGTSVSRSNALRVLENGTILVRESGDISMGDFAQGQQP